MYTSSDPFDLGNGEPFDSRARSLRAFDALARHERAQRVEWSHGESNPDLLNAIQPSSGGADVVHVTGDLLDVCSAVDDLAGVLRLGRARAIGSMIVIQMIASFGGELWRA